MSKIPQQEETLKELQTQLMQAEAKYQEALHMQIGWAGESAALKKQIETIRQKILQKTKTLKVSEHAILRYLSRVLQVDVEIVEKTIMNPDLIEQVRTLGNGTYPIPGMDGVSAVIKDNIVITIKTK